MKKSEYSSYDGLGIAKLIREKEVNVREVLDTAITFVLEFIALISLLIKIKLFTILCIKI